MGSQLDESENFRRVQSRAGRVSGIRVMKLLTTWQRGAPLKLVVFLPCSVTSKSNHQSWAGAKTPDWVT